MGKRKENARMTRQKLLATADRLIVRNGYEDVSVDSIVQANGITKRTFYNYFKRKEDLILELSKARFAGIATQPIQLKNGCVAAVGLI
ncbi:MAG: TetR/AcrR family transcriptional regulator [Sporolactobacillus sp.]